MFIIYKTTNMINGKFYIGVHNGARDWYKGSGSVLKKAVKKYGVENFLRETLYEFVDEESAYLKEQEIVNIELISNPLCYNVRLGGRGGRSGVVTVKDRDTNDIIGTVSTLHPNYVSGKWVHILKGRDTFANARKKALEVRKDKPGPRAGKSLSDSTKEKIRKSRTGTKQSKETIEKRSTALKGFIQPTYICPHCGKEGKGNSMKQWHFEKCKSRMHTNSHLT